MKKVLFLIVVGVLVVPLVIAGSGFTKLFTFATVDDGHLEYSETDAIYGMGATNLSVVNTGDSGVFTLTQTKYWDDPKLEKWDSVSVSPLVCQPVDPYMSKSISWLPAGEAYMHSLTFTEGSSPTEDDYSHVKDLAIYGKGGTGSAGLIVGGEKSFYQTGYTAIGKFCTDVDQYERPEDIEPPEAPDRPDCPLCP